MPDRAPLRRILLASPYPWTQVHPVNEAIARLADALVELRSSGDESVPTPVVVAPTASSHARRATRHALRALSAGAPADDVIALDGDLAGAAAGERRPKHATHRWPLIGLPTAVGPASVSQRAAAAGIAEGRRARELVEFLTRLALGGDR